jgi:hypothetical protein
VKTIGSRVHYGGRWRDASAADRRLPDVVNIASRAGQRTAARPEGHLMPTIPAPAAASPLVSDGSVDGLLQSRFVRVQDPRSGGPQTGEGACQAGEERLPRLLLAGRR